MLDIQSKAEIQWPIFFMIFFLAVSSFESTITNADLIDGTESAFELYGNVRLPIGTWIFMIISKME